MEDTLYGDLETLATVDGRAVLAVAITFAERAMGFTGEVTDESLEVAAAAVGAARDVLEGRETPEGCAAFVDVARHLADTYGYYKGAAVSAAHWAAVAAASASAAPGAFNAGQDACVLAPDDVAERDWQVEHVRHLIAVKRRAYPDAGPRSRLSGLAE